MIGIGKCLYTAVIGNSNCRHPPCLCPLNNGLNLGHPVHITHLRVTVQFHALFQAVIHPFAGKILAFFYPYDTAKRQFMIEFINGRHAPDFYKTALNNSLVHVLHGILAHKKFNGNRIRKIRNIKDNNGLFTAAQFPFLHG